MRIILILLILNLEQFGQAHTANKDTIKVDGDLMIIALFSVHRKSETSADCGEIQEIAGMQRVETALRQIEEINRLALCFFIYYCHVFLPYKQGL